MSVGLIIATAVTSIFVAAVAVGLCLAVTLTLDARRTRLTRSFSPEDQVDDEFRAAQRTMNELAGQSWRNLVD